MVALRGASGVLHQFTKASRGPRSIEVADVCRAEANEIDVTRFYIKALDVDASSAELVAPSYTPMASKLASEYGIRLRNSTKHSRTTLSQLRSGRTG